MPKLEVISGGRRDRLDVGAIAILAAPVSAPPFVPEAKILEEDTFLVLSADPEVRESPAHRVRIFDQAWNLEPKAPGSIVVRERRPLEILAVVHDLGRSPSAAENEVVDAYLAALRLLGQRGLRRVATPLLGAAHRGLDPAAAMRALISALRNPDALGLEGVWLISPVGEEATLIAALADELARQASSRTD